MAPVAVFVGAPGAGKSTIGEAVAGLLGVPFQDADAIIEAKAGKPIPEIFFDDGEDAFRLLERETIAAALRELEAHGSLSTPDGPRYATRKDFVYGEDVTIADWTIPTTGLPRYRDEDS